jgi:signal transduction histidine kinase/ActR/RegA family two-component response regulator
MLVLAGISFALLVAAGLGALEMANRAAEAESSIVRTMNVRRSARVLLVRLLDAETGERGFVLTEDEKFLEPFNRAVGSVSAAIDEMSILTSDDPGQQDRVRNLKPKAEAVLDKLRRTVTLVRQGQRGEAAAIIKSGVGKDLMDRVRTDLDMIFAHETRLLAGRQVNARALRVWVLGLIGLCLAAAMALAVLTLHSMLHYVGRLEAEAKLRRETEDTLRQSQRLDAVGQLTGGIAHDFNNLLTIIVGNLDTMQRRIAQEASELAAKLKEPLDHALQGARSAAQLTHRLLAFSRRQALEPKRVDLNSIVQGMSDLLRRTLGETINVETVLAGGLWPVYADANQLENAVINLAVNARDAMPDGGRLTIETANAYLDEDYIAQFGDVAPGQYVLLSVSDTGTGIATDVLQRAFEPFFTTKGVGKGSGLGLAMVHGFVKQSGGHIRIYSEEGHGTAVKIYLPRLMQADEVAAAPAAAPVRLAPGETYARPRETVLLVEDNDGVRAYAKSALEDLGYRVLEASDAAQALRLVEGEPRIDLLFTDVVLPGGTSGRELADEVVRQRPGLPVLFTTGYTRNAIIHHGRLDPNVNLLNKPFTQQDLARKIRQLLNIADDPPPEA